MVVVSLGEGKNAVEGIIPAAEQVPGEEYTHGKRLRVYVVSVRRELRGPQVVVSRTHPNLVQKLFKLEVPEIEQGIVEIKAIAREAGHRTKIAVVSHDQNVSAKGAFIGPMGQRVRAVTNELGEEKIEIGGEKVAVTVFAAPESEGALGPDDPQPTPEAATVRLFLDDANLIRRVEALLGAEWVTVDFGTAPGPELKLA